MLSESGHRLRQLLMLHLQCLRVNSKLTVKVLTKELFCIVNTSHLVAKNNLDK